MRKALLGLALLAMGTGTVMAQDEIPSRSETKMWKGKHYVRRFQRVLGQHPGSFLIKASNSEGTGLADYLVGTERTLEPSYLHVYFGVRNGDGQKGHADTVLVITGALAQMDPRTGAYTLVHDPKSGVWVTPLSGSSCCIPYDPNPDDKHLGDLDDRCNIANCNNGITLPETAREYIKNFQEGNLNKPGGPIFVTESFLLAADDLRTYMKNTPDAEYLQFYLGYKQQGRYDNFNLVTTGIDRSGHHVFDRDSEGYTYLYDETDPCPKCEVRFDGSLDAHVQGHRNSGTN